MSALTLFCLIACVVATAYGGEVCYKPLGCFNDKNPYGGTAERPIARLPWAPEKIGTRFLLYTESGQLQELKPDKDSIKASSYNTLKKTHFVIHGYLNKDNEKWMVDMCKAIWAVDFENCIIVEWKEGMRTAYPQAANNARVVGAQVAQMVNLLKDHNDVSTTDNFHLIGHSLGAHIAGEAGSRITGWMGGAALGRITGLDPTEPYFEGTPEKVRLDSGDAKFVDVIHTDTLPFNPNLGLGMSQDVGHIDFYPNGGEHQLGCSKNSVSSYPDLDGIWEGLTKYQSCNHLRSYEYYMESISHATGFAGFPCDDQESFEAGKCFPCTGKCPTMGHFADRHGITSVSKHKFYLTTGKASPFARYNYRAIVTIDGSRPNPGFLYVMLVGELGNTDWHQVHVGMMTPGSTYTADLLVEKNIGKLTNMKFSWNNHVPNPMLPAYGATKIELIQSSDNERFLFCGADQVWENQHQVVNPCEE